jgi:hypothetical protein
MHMCKHAHTYTPHRVGQAEWAPVITGMEHFHLLGSVLILHRLYHRIPPELHGGETAIITNSQERKLRHKELSDLT